MPMILGSERTVTHTINAIKVLATPSDNDLNTTTLYPYEGYYDSVTGKFTPYAPLDEHLLDQQKYAELMGLVKARYDAVYTLDPLGIYKAQKDIMYEYLAEALGETGFTVV